MKRLVSMLIIIISLSFFVGVGSICGEEKNPISIGVLAPITGSLSSLGPDYIAGFEIARDEINAAGGVLGRPLKLIIEDDETRPAAGMDAARKLVEVHRVPAIAGGDSSGVGLPIAKYCQERGVVAVFGPPSSPLFRGIGSYIFLMNVMDHLKGKELADFAVQDSGKKKFGLICMNNAFGSMLMKETIKSLENIGAKAVSEVLYEENKVDYKAELKRLFANNPEAIIGTWYGKEGFVTIKQAFEMGLLKVNKVPWYVGEMSSSFGLALKEIPKLLEGIKGLEELKPGSLFLEKFTKKMGREPITTYCAMNYDALIMIAMAINFANSAEPPAIANAMFKIADLYRGQSCGGDKRFDKDGMQRFGSYDRMVVKNGKMVFIGTTK